MSRPVIQVHTIEQWFALDETNRTLILQNIKLRDRLWGWILAQEQQQVMSNDAHTEGWRPCPYCDKKGWIPKRPRRLGIHPSALGQGCMLRVAKEARGEARIVTHDARQQLVYDIGTAIHDMLQEYGLAGAWGPSYRKEVDVGDTPEAKALSIQGHADAENILVVELPHAIFEVGLVHEYKSINDRGFGNLKNRPMPKHKQQAVIYSRCLNRPIVVYLYFNKDNSNLQDFPVPYDHQLWETQRVRAATVYQALQQGGEPQADVGYGCNDCPYHHDCAPYQASKKKG